MKNVNLVILALLLATVVIAATPQSYHSDARGGVKFIPAFDCITISADTAITSSDGTQILAIAPAEDVNVYFGTDTTDKFPITAGQTFAINPNVDVKLDAEVKCLVF